MRAFYRLCLALAALLLGAAGVARATTPIVLRDTLRTAAQRTQFSKALKMAPSTFVYDGYSADGKSYASVTHLRFNDSMRRVLQLDFIQQDARLHKQMRRLYLVTRPFCVTGDLTVRYREVPRGLAIEYRITDLRIWGRRASDRLIREILKANGAR